MSPPLDRITLDLASYQAVRSQTEALAAPLSAEDMLLQSMREASPTKWHLAHTSWFFETFVLERAIPGYRPFHPEFRTLFNSYYNAVSAPWDRNRRGLSRPSLDEVRSYRQHVDRFMVEWLASSAISADVASVAVLGMHHEQQHQELILTDIKHAFSQNPLRPAYSMRAAGRPTTPDAPAVGAHAHLGTWFDHPGGLLEIGAPVFPLGSAGPTVPASSTPPATIPVTMKSDPSSVREGDAAPAVLPGRATSSFVFDNESPRHRVFLEPFRISTHLITNAEFQHFLEDGGYSRPELWLSDGWSVVQIRGWSAPFYWERSGDGWFQHSLRGFEKVQPDEPITHVSFYEADAFARWRGCRLPDEREWEVIARETPTEGNFLESGILHPTGTNRILHPTGPSREESKAVAQLFGDVWEWTCSPYVPYPGFVPAAGPLGEYNGKFMSGQMVLRGGSCVTPRSHIRPTYRNFFPPETRWQFSGIRLAQDVRG